MLDLRIRNGKEKYNLCASNNETDTGFPPSFGEIEMTLHLLIFVSTLQKYKSFATLPKSTPYASPYYTATPYVRPLGERDFTTLLILANAWA